MNADSDVTETVCFVVRNHTMANDLVKCKSKYDCWKLIQCPLFPRLRRLAVADAAGTYGPDMAPIVDYEAELANSVAGFCLANPMPEPLMTVDDLVERGVNPDDIPDMLDMCHKIQVNGNVTKKNSIIGNAIKNLAMSTQSVAENARNLKKRENLFIFF